MIFNFFQYEPALIFDSVYTFARGLHSLERGATLTQTNLSCDEESPWQDGSTLFNYINSVIIHLANLKFINWIRC